MIPTDTFAAVLETLGFQPDVTQSIWRQEFTDGAVLTANFGTQRLTYPAGLLVNEQQPLSFARPENFVVFECVHRLLAKGYLPCLRLC